MGTEIKTIDNKKSKLPIWSKIILAVITFLILSGTFQFLGFLILGIKFTGIDVLKDFNINQLLLLEILGLVATLITVTFYRKFIDKKSLLSLGFEIKGRRNDIFLGCLVAVLIYAIGTSILYFTKEIEFVKNALNLKTLTLSFIFCLIVALNEEIFYRGYILNNLLETGNKIKALTISSFIFTIMHILNFNINFLGVVNIFIAGLLLGSLYIFTKNLWFSITLHLFWNFLQGPILGYHVSGFNLQSFLIQHLSKNNFINGGEFGFEGSIVCSIISILFLIIILKKNKIFITNKI